MVPDAEDRLHFEVRGGRLVGLDNGRQESAENYKADSMPAFNGKALAIVRPDGRPGPGDGHRHRRRPRAADHHRARRRRQDRTARSRSTPCASASSRATTVDAARARSEVVHGDGSTELRPGVLEGRPAA